MCQKLLLDLPFYGDLICISYDLTTGCILNITQDIYHKNDDETQNVNILILLESLLNCCTRIKEIIVLQCQFGTNELILKTTNFTLLDHS